MTLSIKKNSVLERFNNSTNRKIMIRKTVFFKDYAEQK